MFFTILITGPNFGYHYTIHTFDDGNGHIAGAIAEMLLARADQNKRHFYSMATQIPKEHNEYYDAFEKTQTGDLDITIWLEWFLNFLYRSMDRTNQTIDKIIERNHFLGSHHNTTFNVRKR
ncbi:hypothetical protein U0033_18625 [Chitinophaga sancti]|uniref:Fido domain-containing protein n=1 Tax=Chitinophaga sancti TaxID=1004 RepID=A0ABZ0XCB4_9BACT|nr:hypothetical protein [Chitinophaga sancti]WQD59907.1 hypothetical protein U0033_18625 [Chitinophaga sancti]WQG87963.1 hypothetical protein SR876_23840 [Chitinophaga sancti]